MSEEFDKKELAFILGLLEKHQVTEFSLERGDQKLSLKRASNEDPSLARTATYLNAAHYSGAHYSAASGHHHPHNHPYGHSQQWSSHSADQPSVQPIEPGGGGTARPSEGATVNPAQGAVSPSSLLEVTSPMVGTFYRRPAVDADPYVEVGKVVKKGDVLCIVEAMKLMNEVESPYAGRVIEVRLNDGQMVEYGEVLFKIEPI